jgi:hypothetical protein
LGSPDVLKLRSGLGFIPLPVIRNRVGLDIGNAVCLAAPLAVCVVSRLKGEHEERHR